ncbi:MAG: tRNA (N6-threonylcarbamoyladenosine(37)-N6)-methyltransferase TrmO [Halodesulfurarchaeum sp.]
MTTIGHVESEFEEPAPPETMRGTRSTIVIDEEYAPGLTGIEQRGRVTVLFEFHESEGFDLVAKRHRGTDRRGVFASRSPNRPTPIGVTTAKLIEREGRRLLVEGLDAIDGTPVLDIKPYSAEMDAAADLG